VESQESLLRRFQRMVQTSGILREVKAGRHLSAKSGATRIKAQKKRPAEAVTGYL
jgi:ribosomal protein S21